MRKMHGMAHLPRIGRGLGADKGIASVFSRRVNMRIAVAGLAILVAGCADIRVPIASVHEHLQETKRVLSAPVTPEIARETANFHVTRSLGWTKAMLEHKGMPDQPVVVPYEPSDYRAIAEEDAAMEKYEADVEDEKALTAAVSGWFGKTLGIGGGRSLAAIIGLLLRNLKKKKTALAEYDSAMDELPPKKRKALGEKRPAMSEAHEGLKQSVA